MSSSFKKNRRVGIIIPTYNRWPYVCQAVDSVLKQDYKEVECIVIDDGSTDDTDKMLRQKYKERITILRLEKNRGQSYARNYGVANCDCQWISFLDSDDLLFENAVSSRIRTLEKTGCDVAYGLILDGKKRHDLEIPIGELSIKNYLSHTSLCHNNSFLIGRDDFLNINGYNTSLFNKEDIEFIIRMIIKYDCCYCGETIGEKRSVDNRRARNNHDRIVQQGFGFSEAVLNSGFFSEISPYFDRNFFINIDLQELLRSLYKTRKYKEYCDLYEKASSEMSFKEFRSLRFRKRYFFSRMHNFLSN
ncbi:glycosyltransferase family 2 protein [Nitratifractor sp.]|uniref:glycosyltransferase family 2 protein n=1 Tax=Nitratifractor sp. TaxID=2268144 RepID=UPI0025E193FD|nr:glycosyltransferase family 2 protein [Nitratifractor sp.]